MWAGNGRVELSVRVDDVDVKPTSSLELLGVKIDSKLSLEPHLGSVAQAAWIRAAMVARLSCHLPSGPYLTQLAKGIVLGKVGYGIAAVSTPRLEGDTSSPSQNTMSIQVAMNDVARTLSGCVRRDHIKVQDLLTRASMPSYNEVSVRAIAMETWKAYHSLDGPDGSRNPLGKLIFSEGITSDSRTSRAATEGIIPLPLRSRAGTFVWNASTVWNSSKALREASTKTEAMKVAKNLARQAPI